MERSCERRLTLTPLCLRKRLRKRLGRPPFAGHKILWGGGMVKKRAYEQRVRAGGRGQPLCLALKEEIREGG